MRKTAVRADFTRPRRGAAPKAGGGNISKCSSVSAGNHSTMKERTERTERTIFQAIALADVAMMVPAVMALEKNWLAPVYYIEVVLLAAIVAAAFVAVDHLSRI